MAKSSKEKLLKVLKIAYEISYKGSGISLNKAMIQCDYNVIRKNIDIKEMIFLLQSNSNLTKDWIQYSEDKRTSGGFFIKGKIVGSIDNNIRNVSYKSKEIALANFILRELDFWLKIN